MNELIVPYEPTVLAEKAERWRRLMRSRITSLVITIVIMTVIFVWQRDQLQGAGFVAVYGVVLGISVAILAVTVVGYLPLSPRTRRRRHRDRHPGRPAGHPGGRTGRPLVAGGAAWSRRKAAGDAARCCG